MCRLLLSQPCLFHRNIAKIHMAFWNVVFAAAWGLQGWLLRSPNDLGQPIKILVISPKLLERGGEGKLAGQPWPKTSLKRCVFRRNLKKIRHCTRALTKGSHPSEDTTGLANSWILSSIGSTQYTIGKHQGSPVQDFASISQQFGAGSAADWLRGSFRHKDSPRKNGQSHLREQETFGKLSMVKLEEWLHKPCGGLREQRRGMAEENFERKDQEFVLDPCICRKPLKDCT